MTDDNPVLATKPQIIDAILAVARTGLGDADIDPELISEVGIEVMIRQRPPAEPIRLRITAPTDVLENPEVIEVTRPYTRAAQELASLRTALERPPRLGCELNAHRDLGYCEFCAGGELDGWRLLAMAQRGVAPQPGVSHGG